MEIKLFKRKKSFKKEGSWLDLNLYWKLAILVIFAATILSIFLGYYLFMEINKEFIAPISIDSGQIETVKKERIEKVLLYFSLREEKSTQILNSSPSITDPSL